MGYLKLHFKRCFVNSLLIILPPNITFNLQIGHFIFVDKTITEFSRLNGYLFKGRQSGYNNKTTQQ
jgi:hypothetical protein